MSLHQPAANAHVPGPRRAVGTIVGFCVTFLSVVLTSLAPGLASNGPVSAAGDTGAFVAAGPHRLADTRSAPCGCRRLATASCRGREGFAPKNAVNAIRSASGSFGTVVMMAGYDDWWTVFPSGFDQVVAAAREKGARTIVWLTFREGARYHGASETFVKNNATMRDKIASGLFPDVVLADWNSYTATTSGWLAGDGVHLSLAGSYAAADYISRKLAFVENRACPMPWVVGEAVDVVCPDPDTHSPVADIIGLYRS